MAMTKCRECTKEVSEWAKKCPNCGVTKPDKTIYYGHIAVTVLIVAVVLIAGGFYVVKTLSNPRIEVLSKRISAEVYQDKTDGPTRGIESNTT